jgi:hypothetical protein
MERYVVGGLVHGASSAAGCSVTGGTAFLLLHLSPPCHNCALNLTAAAMKLCTMNRLVASLTLCVAAGAASAAPQLALPGEAFHGDEVPARNGESWLALVVAGSTAKLQAAKLVVEAVNDPVLDGDDEKTGRSVAAPGIEALVFLRGMAALKPGDVNVAMAESTPLDVARPLELRLGDKRLSLLSRCADSGDESGGIRCEVVLDDGAVAQTLFTTYAVREEGSDRITFGDAVPTVQFAGDLDRDGRVDLLIDTTDHYNLSRPTLFLSGAAKNGQHVAEVARQELTGC